MEFAWYEISTAVSRVPLHTGVFIRLLNEVEVKALAALDTW